MISAGLNFDRILLSVFLWQNTPKLSTKLCMEILPTHFLKIPTNFKSVCVCVCACVCVYVCVGECVCRGRVTLLTYPRSTPLLLGNPLYQLNTLNLDISTFDVNKITKTVFYCYVKQYYIVTSEQSSYNKELLQWLV